MKFLLVGINAKYIHSNPAIYSLAAYAGSFTQNGKSLKDCIELAEYTINQNTEEILSDIYLRKPDVIGFSCYIWNISMVTELLEMLHQVCPVLPIWLGGPEVSYRPKELLEQYPYLEGIMTGEGEKTFHKLLQHYCSEKESYALGDIEGIVTKDFQNESGECLSLDEIPFLYENLSEFTNRIIYYESSRGCPFRCSYCLSSIDKTVRFRSIEKVCQELQFFLDRKVPQVKFIDRTFNANHEHAMAVWNYIREHDNGVTNFHFEISADLLKEEEIKLLNTCRPGLVQLEIGVQSTNEHTISSINRKMDLNKLRKAVEGIHRGENIHEHLDLIAGLPYEDIKSFRNSFNEVYAMHPNQLQLGFLKVLSGAKMHEDAEQYGIVYRKKPPYEVLYTRWISFDDMILLKKVEAMVELYYNSAQFYHTIHFLEAAFLDAFTMFESLAAYYEKNGYFVMTAKRIYHYDILLAFVKEYDKKNENIYRELLTFDLYLRENMKTRPSFSIDLDAYKKEIRLFYQTEEKTRKQLPDYASYDAKQMSKMTHLEYFHYPVWEQETGKIKNRLSCPQGILFDYQNRNPLSLDANIIFV